MYQEEHDGNHATLIGKPSFQAQSNIAYEAIRIKDITLLNEEILTDHVRRSEGRFVPKVALQSYEEVCSEKGVNPEEICYSNGLIR